MKSWACWCNPSSIPANARKFSSNFNLPSSNSWSIALIAASSHAVVDGAAFAMRRFHAGCLLSRSDWVDMVETFTLRRSAMRLANPLVGQADHLPVSCINSPAW
jgi:hypothetical protein